MLILIYGPLKWLWNAICYCYKCKFFIIHQWFKLMVKTCQNNACRLGPQKLRSLDVITERCKSSKFGGTPFRFRVVSLKMFPKGGTACGSLSFGRPEIYDQRSKMMDKKSQETYFQGAQDGTVLGLFLGTLGALCFLIWLFCLKYLEDSRLWTSTNSAFTSLVSLVDSLVDLLCFSSFSLSLFPFPFSLLSGLEASQSQRLARDHTDQNDNNFKELA